MLQSKELQPVTAKIGSLQSLQKEDPLVPNVLMSTQILQNLAVTLLETPGTPAEREIMRLQALNILKFSIQEDPLRQIPAGTRVEEVKEEGDGQVRVTVIYQAERTAGAPAVPALTAPQTREQQTTDNKPFLSLRTIAEQEGVNVDSLQSAIYKAKIKGKKFVTQGLGYSTVWEVEQVRKIAQALIERAVKRSQRAVTGTVSRPLPTNARELSTPPSPEAAVQETAVASAVEKPAATPQLPIALAEKSLPGQATVSNEAANNGYLPLRQIIEKIEGMTPDDYGSFRTGYVYPARAADESIAKGKGSKTCWNEQRVRKLAEQYLAKKTQGAEANTANPLPANSITDTPNPVVASEISTLAALETTAQEAAPVTQPAEQTATPQPIAKAVEAPKTNRVVKQPVAGEVKPKEEYRPLKEIIEEMGATSNYHILRTQIYSARDKGEIESKKAGVNTLWNVQQVRVFIAEFSAKRKQDAEVSDGNSPLSTDQSTNTTDSPATKGRKPLSLEEAREKMRRILEQRSADSAPNEPQFIGLEEAATRYNVDLTDLRFATRERMRGGGINPEDCEGIIDGQIDVQTTRFPICLIDTLAASLPKAQAA